MKNLLLKTQPLPCYGVVVIEGLVVGNTRSTNVVTRRLLLQRSSYAIHPVARTASPVLQMATRGRTTNTMGAWQQAPLLAHRVPSVQRQVPLAAVVALGPAVQAVEGAQARAAWTNGDQTAAERVGA